MKHNYMLLMRGPDDERVAHLTAQVHYGVLHDAVGEPEHPQQHDHDADAREDERRIGADGAQQDTRTKQQRRQHRQAELARHQAHLVPCMPIIKYWKFLAFNTQVTFRKSSLSGLQYSDDL